MGKLSPFGNIPKVLIEAIYFTKITVITAIALVLTVIGFMGYNKRDIQG